MSRAGLLRKRAIGLFAAMGVALAVMAASASAASATRYTATISPTATSTGHTDTYTVTIASRSPLWRLIGFDVARITVPTGYTNVSVGKPSNPRWRAFYNSATRTITLVSRFFLPGRSVSIPITATAPTTAGAYTWQTTARTTLRGPATLLGSQPSVQVAGSVVACPAGQSCDSGQLSAPASGQSPATSADVVAAPGPQNDVLITNLPDPVVHSMSCQQANFGQIVQWSVTSRSSTLTYTVKPATEYEYDISDTCFGSTKPFKTADGSTSPFFAPNNEFEGSLPMCAQSSPTPPCVESISEVETVFGNDEPNTFTILAPTGDPRYTG